MRILIVEDEEHMAIGLKFNFEAEGYAVAVANDGPSALDMFREASPAFDLVVLDLMLPGMSGYETCGALRVLSKDVPILVLTARTLSEDRTRAFECGTDQYLTKPFELRELLARVRNLVERRRSSAEAANGADEGPDEIKFGDCEVSFRTFEAKKASQPVKLTPMEIQLLRFFARNEGTVLSRAEILERAWGITPPPTTRTVDNFVLRLRKHFETDPANPRHFLSVRGAGYRFVADPNGK